MISKVVISPGEAVLHNEFDKPVGTTTTLLPYLYSYIEFAPETRLYDLWKLLVEDLSVYNVIYQEVLGRHDLNTWAKLVPTDCPPKPIPENPKECIEYLEIYWSAEINGYDESASPQFMKIPNIHGFGPQIDKWGPDGTTEITGGWSICFTPFQDLLPYPISLKADFNILFINKRSRERLEETYQSFFRVSDVLWAIFEEISFFGSPVVFITT